MSKLNDDGLTSVQLKGRKRKYDIPLFRIGEYSYAKPTIIENKYKEY